MSGITGVVVGAGVLAAGASAYGASQQAGATSDANAANAANAMATNEQNERLYHESRGSKGFSILPEYMKRNGKPFEKRLAGDAMQFYRQLDNRRSPKELMTRAQTAVNTFKPSQAAAEQTVSDLFSGALTQEALGNLEPLAAERLQSAQTLREAGQNALAEQLGGINRNAARQGFVGDTFGNRLLASTAMRNSMSDAAIREAAAREQNAADAMKVKQTALVTRLQSLNLPFAMAQNKVATGNLSENAALDQAARRQQLLEWFRIGPGSFRYSPLPQVSPVASTGQIVAQGVGAAAGAAGGFYANKALIADMNAYNRGGVQNQWTPNPNAGRNALSWQDGMV